MKWLVCLFSLYILLLSGIPCNADDDCCIDEISVTTSQNEETPDPDHKPACPCSPFFACGACHGVVVPNTNIEFSNAIPPVIKPQYFYTERFLPGFQPAIWQPPKTA